MNNTNLFINRNKEIDYIVGRIRAFPKPSMKHPRTRRILTLIGPKGVGKSAILKRIYSIGIEDTCIVYIEFKSMYRSVDELLYDLIEQLRNTLNHYMKIQYKIKEYGLRLINKFIEKYVGIEVRDLDFVKKYSDKPFTLFNELVEYLSDTIGSMDNRLLIIIDEFQFFLKTLEQLGYKDLHKMFIHYLSKTQEWGFNGVKGYPIYILSTSDYTYYQYIASMIGYIETLYINELCKKDSIELLKRVSIEKSVLIKDNVYDRVYSFLGGNPALLIDFVDRVVSRGYRVVDIDTAVYVLNKLVEELWIQLKHLLSNREVELLRKLCRSISISREYKQLLDSLVNKNIVYYVGDKILFQNMLLRNTICKNIG